MKRFAHGCLLSSLVLLAHVSQGHGATLMGDFSATYSAGDPEYQGIPTLSGTWMATYDEANISLASPLMGSLQTNVDSIDVDPAIIGAVTFSSSNTRVVLHFSRTGIINPGPWSLSRVDLYGGDDMGEAYSGIEDGFAVVYYGLDSGSPLVVHAVTDSGLTGVSEANGPGSVAIIPEPSAAILVLAGSFFAALRRPRRRKGSH